MKITPFNKLVAWLSALALTGVSVYAADAPAASPAATATPASSDAAPASRPNSAIVPMPQRGAAYLTRHQSFIDIATKGDVDILFIGDSITDNWNRVDRGKPVWDQYYGNAKAANFGIGSDKTQNVLWRVQNGELPAGFKPKVAVMLIGTNNVGGNTPAEIAEGVGAIIKEFRTRTPDTKILLLAIFPRDYKDTPNRLGVFAANQQVSKLDDGKHVFYFDIGQKFLDGDGNFIPGLFWDTPPLHPIVPGYTIWADAIKEPLDNLLHGKDLYGFPIPPDQPVTATAPGK